ncbi:MAG: hypothetical protein ACI875_002225, partial [Planctomycetota bacterium]
TAWLRLRKKPKLYLPIHPRNFGNILANPAFQLVPIPKRARSI